MEPRKPGSNKLPDFDQLNDRIIADHTSEPMLVIKTNLDPDDATENNPYAKGKKSHDKESFNSFFED